MSPNVHTVGRVGSDSCRDDGLHHIAKGGGLRLLLAALAEEQEPWMESGRMNHFSAPLDPDWSWEELLALGSCR